MTSPSKPALAAVVAVVCAAIVILAAGRPALSAFPAFLLAFILPGASARRWLPLAVDGGERWVLMVGASLVLSILAAVPSVLLPTWREQAWAVILATICVAGGVSSSMSQAGQSPPQPTRRLACAAALAVAVVILEAGAYWIAASSVGDHSGPGFTSLEMLPSSGQLLVTVTNHEREPTIYALTVREPGKGDVRRVIRVPSAGSWSLTLANAVPGTTARLASRAGRTETVSYGGP